MKTRFTLIALAILAILTGYSQNFIDENKQWNVIFEAGGVPGHKTEIYTIDGETTIAGVTYQQLWVSQDSLATRSIKGFLREANNQVYYLPEGVYKRTNEAFLLYDFNLEVGDTTTIINDFGLATIKVLNIDTVQYEGVARKRWEISGIEENTYPSDYWIEGIGSTNGIIYSVFWENVVCPSWTLSCYYEGGNLMFKNPCTAYCYVENNLGVEDNTDNLYVNLSPNPVQQGNNLYIDNTLQVQHIAIYTISGQLVKEISVSENTKIEVSTRDMLKGLYLVRLTAKNNKTLTQKLLVQ